MGAAFIPDRGDVVWIHFDPQAGHEQAGRRPGVILTPASYNKLLGLAILCPITSRVKGYPFEVPIPPGLEVTGVVLSDQAKSFDWRARKAHLITKLGAPVVESILQRLRTLL